MNLIWPKLVATLNFRNVLNRKLCAVQGGFNGTPLVEQNTALCRHTRGRPLMQVSKAQSTPTTTHT